MAESEEKNKKTEEKNEPKEQKKGSGGLMTWLIMAGVVVVMGGAGLGLGKFLGSSGTKHDPNSVSTEHKPENEEAGGGQGGGHGGGKETKKGESAGPKTCYYDLDAVIANLNEPGATRYIRVTLTLEMSDKLEQTQGKIFLDDKKPILTNWLTIFLTSLTLEDVTGDRNLKRLQSIILDAFNQELYPNAKPMVQKILFKEFAIQ